MIVVDTTVLVYALGTDAGRAEASSSLLTAVAEGTVQATTTHEVIQEFAYVRARRHGRTDAARHARRYLDLLSPLVPITDVVLRSGLTLFETHERIGSFDAVLAAAAIEAEAEALVTDDRGLLALDVLRCLTPDDPEIQAMLD